ncbi:hypothetical protein V8E53_002758 [Lactarius tabidus]
MNINIVLYHLVLCSQVPYWRWSMRLIIDALVPATSLNRLPIHAFRSCGCTSPVCCSVEHLPGLQSYKRGVAFLLGTPSQTDT